MVRSSSTLPVAFLAACLAATLIACTGIGSGSEFPAGRIRGEAPDGSPSTQAGTATTPPLDAVIPIGQGAVDILGAWQSGARIGGLDLDVSMTDAEVDVLLRQRKAENVSVLEIDTRLSEYLTDAEFDREVAFLDRVSNMAHAIGLRAVAYYPALEVLSPNASAGATMANAHPEWLQHGINGAPNVFVGGQEHWVDADVQSAWMSPNSGYRDYFITRMEKLARTRLDGVWIDVPLYLQTGAPWPGAEAAAASAFSSWSGGARLPTAVDFSDATFKAWIRWRHENLADFVEDVRARSVAANPSFWLIVENYPMDYDGTAAGLDGTFYHRADNMLVVWEVDSVSNTRAMKNATVADFDNKIAMFKWARGVDQDRPTWVFSYGDEPLDASLVMAAAVATGSAPFESKTPDMTRSVGTAFRTEWFGFLRENAPALFGVERRAEVGVWYSAATRDYHDFAIGGSYGMYPTTRPPVADADWWATAEEDSLIGKPHLSGWRGAARALHRWAVPYRVVAEPGDVDAGLAGLELLWLPSVAAMSDESATQIAAFAEAGGVVLATGAFPGRLDDRGETRQTSALASLFGAGDQAGARAKAIGRGYAIYRPDLRGADLFDADGDTFATLQQLVRLHTGDPMITEASEGTLIEIGVAAPNRHHLYVVDYSGLQVPLVHGPRTVRVGYRMPEGLQLDRAIVNAPGREPAPVPFVSVAQGIVELEIEVDIFAIVNLTFGEANVENPPSYSGPMFDDAERERIAVDGLAFVKSSMRDSSKPAPWRYGVFTNLIDRNETTEIYAHGHHTTAEHMGLMLRASACMSDRDAFSESVQYVRDVLISPLYGVVNWAVDSNALRPLIQEADEAPQWLAANAPLDDFRVAKGLLQGSEEGLARRVFDGLYWTSVTHEHSGYEKGLVAYSWDWANTDDASLQPIASSTGLGTRSGSLIPIDYQDLEAMGLAARRDPRWQPVLQSATDLLITAELSSAPGLFYNGLELDGTFTGDFENRDTNQGNHLKTIQVLWIGLHLARVSQFDDLLDAARLDAARQAALRTLRFFEAFYEDQERIPEYLTVFGGDVPTCDGEVDDQCLEPDENLIEGEVRIYALAARLALALQDGDVADRFITKITEDVDDDPSSPRYGAIGPSTASDDDAEAWNVLESVLSLCQRAGGK